MTNFPTPILDYWHNTFVGSSSTNRGTLSCAVSEMLNPKRPAMMLEMDDGLVRAVVRPEVAKRIGIDDASILSPSDLQERLAGAGVALHDPDYLFYLPTETQLGPGPDQARAPRQLTDADRAAFDAFYYQASEQDREDAFVELDHWAVFGYFDGDRLVSAASMCLWDGSPVADLGVLTLPDDRGKGFARAVVQSINRFSRQQGYEPQYRCQLDNHASAALAKACGLMLFGKWMVATDALEQGDG